MTWTVHAVHPQAPDVPVEAEVEDEQTAAAVAMLFEGAGCSTAYWPEP